jgi:hypothetical protein
MSGLAAQIYLCGLVPNTVLSDNGPIAVLITRLAGAPQRTPVRLSRSLIWPL